MPRLLKKFLYGFAFLVIVVGILSGIYLVLKPPVTHPCPQGTAFNGVACIPSDLKSLYVSDGVRIFPVDATHVSFVIKVVNENLEFAAKNFDYTLTLQEGSSTEILDGISYMYAGEVRMFVFPNRAVKDARINNVSIQFSNIQWVPADSWKRPQLTVQNVGARRDPRTGGIVVEGVFRNEDVNTFPVVEVGAIFRDASGALLGASRTEVQQVVPASVGNFQILHPDIPRADLSRTSVFLNTARP